jgi:hypothetical protein
MGVVSTGKQMEQAGRKSGVWEWPRWERIDQQEKEYSRLKEIVSRIILGLYFAN